MACNKVKLFPCGGSMSHTGIIERGREGGRGEGDEGGEMGTRRILFFLIDVFALISHESCSVCMSNVSLCYSIGAGSERRIASIAHAGQISCRDETFVNPNDSFSVDVDNGELRSICTPAVLRRRSSSSTCSTGGQVVRTVLPPSFWGPSTPHNEGGRADENPKFPDIVWRMREEEDRKNCGLLVSKTSVRRTVRTVVSRKAVKAGAVRTGAVRAGAVGQEPNRLHLIAKTLSVYSSSRTLKNNVFLRYIYARF